METILRLKWGFTPGHMNDLALRRIKVHIPSLFPIFLIAQCLSVGSQSQLEWIGQGTWLCHLQINGPWILPDPEGHLYKPETTWGQEPSFAGHLMILGYCQNLCH